MHTGKTIRSENLTDLGIHGRMILKINVKEIKCRFSAGSNGWLL
jgi:hypothetical protein